MQFTQDFIEKLLLLIATAILSGLLAPVIIKVFESARTKELKILEASKALEQKEKEAVLLRQTKIIDAQATFLSDIARYLWQWRYLAVKMTYYAGKKEREAYENAKNEYEQQKWNSLSSIRHAVSQSHWLVSESAYNRVLGLYKQIVEFDQQITNLYKEEDNTRWLSFKDMNVSLYEDLTKEIDKVLHLLATETQLSGVFVTLIKPGTDCLPIATTMGKSREDYNNDHNRSSK